MSCEPADVTAATEHEISSSVLVVDRSAESRGVLAGWLRRAGATVHESAAGVDALDLLTRVRIDLVLLHADLPDLTAFQVCDRIKSTRATAAIAVLSIRARATDPRERSAGLDAGADGYLVQPVERDELLAAVTSLLRYREVLRASERLAARLERLHQTTLLMNAATTVADLIMFAATGLTELFAVPTAVLVTRDGIGRMAQARPNQLEPMLLTCQPSTVLTMAQAAQAGAAPDLGMVARPLGISPTSTTRAAPIMTPRGELVGVAILLVDDGAPQDELVLDLFSQALAVAFENQRIYDVEHQIALTLQHSMLPQSLPRPDRLELAVRYQAASETVEIGGDFYEAIALDRHTTLLAIGDVLGHSLQAATVMAELRYSLRAFAQLGLSAADIVTRLNLTLCESHPNVTATFCIAQINTADDEIHITNAGHIPPLVRRGTDVVFVQEHGPLLGLRGVAAPPTVTLPFGPGAVVVLVTDGLIERRAENLTLGLERLARITGSHKATLDDLCDVLIHQVGAGAATFDDIAIIAARRHCAT
jgi:serine phosphatase RsbU (regulator of sigma subunit)/DNA-binding response OmpR family regulator